MLRKYYMFGIKLLLQTALYSLNETIERESTIYYKWKLIHTIVLDEWNEEIILLESNMGTEWRNYEKRKHY